MLNGEGSGQELIDWISSVILCVTIGIQLHRQYRAGTCQGVSRWLYLGQLAAEVGFIAYSLLVRNWVFVFTNSVLLVESMLGVVLVRSQRRRKRSRASYFLRSFSRTRL